MFDAGHVDKVIAENQGEKNWLQVSESLTNLCLSPGGLGDTMFQDLVSSIVGKMTAEEVTTYLDGWLTGKALVTAEEVALKS